MSVYRATTRSAQVYEITDRGFWRHDDEWHRILTFKNINGEILANIVDVGGQPAGWGYINNEVENAEGAKPEVGKRMYLVSKDYWRLSTPVVMFEEIEDNFDD